VTDEKTGLPITECHNTSPLSCNTTPPTTSSTVSCHTEAVIKHVHIETATFFHIWCHATLQNLNVQQCKFTAELFDSKVMQNYLFNVIRYVTVLVHMSMHCRLIYNVTACVQNVHCWHIVAQCRPLDALTMCCSMLNEQFSRCCCLNVVT